MTYEWRDDQLWDHERGCWVVWRTISGQIGATDDMRAKIANALNDLHAIEHMLATTVGRTPEAPLSADVARLVVDFTRKDQLHIDNAVLRGTLSRILDLVAGVDEETEIGSIAGICRQALGLPSPLAGRDLDSSCGP